MSLDKASNGVELTLMNALAAAEHHGQSSEPEHQVGDLEDMLRVAYSLMTKEQRHKLLHSTMVKGLIEQEL